MRKAGSSIALAAVLALPLSVAAQTQPSLTKIYHVRPKGGSEKQFEDAIKRHQAWHQEQKDPRTWYVFVTIMGDRFGEYHFVLPNQTLEELDKHADLERADSADARASMGPLWESVTADIRMRDDDLSLVPAGQAPKSLAWVSYAHLNPGRVDDYRLYLQKIKAAREKVAGLKYFATQVINGSEIPAFSIVVPFGKWAELQPPRTREVLTAAYGAGEAQRLIDLRDAATHCVRSSVVAFRPDLSYIPAK